MTASALDFRTGELPERRLPPSRPAAVATGGRGRRSGPVLAAAAGWFRDPRLIGLTTALAATALLAWGLGRPAPWLDETASIVATQRTWPELWHLFGGDETPLLPFYAVLKVASAALVGLLPALARDPEVLYRLPSVVAAVAAAGLFTCWVARQAGPGLAGAAGAVLLSSAGFSRYGQEARPYAFALLLSVLCTATWWRLARTGRRRWIPAYALTVALLVCTHLLSAMLLPAHLLAAVLAVPAGGRRRALLGSGAGIAVGLAAVSPFLATAARAGGATRAPAVTDLNLFIAVDRLFALPPAGLVQLELVLPALALLGLAGVARRARPEEASIARLAACWALVPTLLFVLAVIHRHNLLLGRYVLFSLPGWSILAGLGLLRLAGWAGRVGRGGWVRPWLSGTATATALAVLVSALVGGQLSMLRDVRAPAGHGEDIRPALAAATGPDTRHLALMSNSRFGAIEVSALDPGQERRWIGLSAQRNQQYIWPTKLAPAVRAEQLRSHRTIGLLLRLPAAPWCPAVAPTATVAFVQRCLPTPLSFRGYQVVSATGVRGSHWIFAVLDRP